ncbi:SDR family oxidoreductase [Rhodohalobacter sp. SW132]|uniref:SDR family oxidoreductase n=1 Tax=Rhodohalobacter sp. SW132 TaxID=2293433 RepID=UPI000E27CE84|nr:SDR family oxidoreductase [Rhodohalobacter sp. SW132]REL33174.1 SDR family oxidoreductase [Rhodohalobacter sp. SW132]
MKNLFDLSGKIAIVTGGNGVLGGAMSEGLANAGAKVGVLGRTEKTVQEQVDKINQSGGEALSLIADVLQKDDLKKVRTQVEEKWGQVDILVNAAGGNMPGATINPDQSFLDMDDQALSKVVDLNFKGTYLPSKLFAESMIENKRGVIVNISSMAAQQAITRVMGYSAAKSAVDNFTRSLAIETALKYGDGIRVNAIAPGFFIGEQNRDLLLNSDGSLTDRGQTIINNTPMQRFGEAEELIGTVVWLCSDASSFVTGTVIPVDGGFSAYSGV